ncbi:hypothetical protein SAICODRAFT_7656 [Saitoella complicata NRRL Y-17804]|nr:uncharacterized protein SAICODRAFT_7656 [Saitoella complicata NRRL Y-17804]ODQ53060.1 hypothetical protein SAICODRAFT_7656 [Saitoella complicata NRRL Y-17804]
MFTLRTSLRSVLPRASQPCQFAQRTFFSSARAGARPSPSSAFAIVRARFATPAKRGLTASALDPSAAVRARPDEAEKWKRIGLAGALFGGTIFATNLLLNRETRASLSPYERSYLNETFMYVGAGLGLTALAARGLHLSGFSQRLMMMNPWLVMGGSLVASVGSMYGTLNTHPNNSGTKHLFWTAFQLTQGAMLAPLFFVNPAILVRAGLYTAGVVGSIAYVGATARDGKYLYLGGPLLAGCSIVALSALAPMVLPLGTRALAVTENLYLYGGLAVFGGFTLYDTQKMLNHAKQAQVGARPRDPVAESLSLELDFINIFIRLVQILQMSGGNNRR